MSWRAAAWLFALALAGLGFWWLDNWIASQGWAIHQGEGWRMVASGWYVLRVAWPVALAGIIPGVLLAWYMLDNVAHKAAAADYAERQRRIEAERQRLDEQRQEHAAKMDEAQRRIEAARAAQQRAEQEIAAAAARVARAEQHAASADRRRRNATAAAGRMRRKLNM